MQVDAGASFNGLVDLAAAAIGGEALSTNDEFFAERQNLLKPGRGVFIPDAYTDRGKWMDGWESRRKRGPGHDWCIIKLGVPGRIRALDIDTNHFLGNHPPFASVEALNASPDTPAELLENACLDRDPAPVRSAPWLPKPVCDPRLRGRDPPATQHLPRRRRGPPQGLG
jgi:allantoicase